MNPREHSMRQVFFRVASYSVALMAILWVSQRYFGDTYTANVVLFSLFTFSFELLYETPPYRGFRHFCYVICVLGLALFGLSLLCQSLDCRNQNTPQCPQREENRP